MKKTWFGLLVTVLGLILSLVFLGGQDSEGVMDAITAVPLWTLGTLAFLWAVLMVLDGLGAKLLLTSMTPKVSKATSQPIGIVRLVQYGIERMYWNLITPLAIAGHGVYAARLVPHGVKAGRATAFSVIKFVLYSLVMSLGGFLGLLYMGFQGSQTMPSFIVQSMVVVGLITLVIALFWILVFISPHRVLGLWKSLGTLFPPAKKQLPRLMRSAVEARNAILHIREGGAHELLKVVLIQLGTFAVQTLMVALVFVATSMDGEFWVLWAKGAILVVLMGYMVLPGNFGLVELVFVVLFGSQNLPQALLGVLLYRLSSQYLTLITGFILSLIKGLGRLGTKEKQGLTFYQHGIVHRERLYP